MPIRLTISNQTRARVDRAWLARKLRGVLARLGKAGEGARGRREVGAVKEAEWSITLVDDAAMAELHGRTMNDPTTTDVLTFDLRDAGTGQAGKKKREREGAAVELDTVVCVDEARRRARELGHGLGEELLLYCVHSLLHVQGYDDLGGEEAFEAMHRREDELLVAVGVGPVYRKQAKMAKPRRRNPGGKRP